MRLKSATSLSDTSDNNPLESDSHFRPGAAATAAGRFGPSTPPHHRPGHRPGRFGFVALVAALAVMAAACTGGGPDTPPVTSPSSTIPKSELEGGLEPVLAVMAELSGTFVGTWINQAEAQSGPITLNLRVDEDRNVLVADLEVGGPVFGGATPGPEQLVGEPDGLNVRFDALSPSFGLLDAVIGRDGLRATLVDVPVPTVDRVEVVGTFDFATGGIDATYTVFKADGSTSEGSFVLNRDDAPAARVPPTLSTTTLPPEGPCADPPCEAPG